MIKVSTLALAAGTLVALAGLAGLTRSHAQASALVPDAAPTPCKSSNACLTETNNGSGAALKGVSLDVKVGKFGQAAIVARANGLGGMYSFSNQFYGGEFESAGTSASAYGLVAATDAASGIAFLAEGTGGSAYIDGSGNVYAKQYLEIGSGSSGTTFAAYGAASTRATIEDTGTARLTNGAGSVRFDSALTRIIDVQRGYQVFLTPDGDVRGPLYVSQKFAGGFTVRESQGGRSSIFFDYRVVAQRAGSSDARLPAVQQPQAPQLGRHDP